MIPQAHVVAKQLEELREQNFQAECRAIKDKITKMIGDNQSIFYIDSMSDRMNKHLTDLGYTVKHYSAMNETTYSISVNKT